MALDAPTMIVHLFWAGQYDGPVPLRAGGTTYVEFAEGGWPFGMVAAIDCSVWPKGRDGVASAARAFGEARYALRFFLFPAD